MALQTCFRHLKHWIRLGLYLSLKTWAWINCFKILFGWANILPPRQNNCSSTHNISWQRMIFSAWFLRLVHNHYSNWLPAHLKQVLIFFGGKFRVCDEVRQMVAAAHTPLIWRGSQAKPISSCPLATWTTRPLPRPGTTQRLSAKWGFPPRTTKDDNTFALESARQDGLGFSERMQETQQAWLNCSKLSGD